MRERIIIIVALAALTLFSLTMTLRNMQRVAEIEAPRPCNCGPACPCCAVCPGK